MYAKIFASMFDGSLATRGPWEALVTFQQLLIICDPRGIVDKTPERIAAITTIPLDIIQKGIVELEKPDPMSRSAAEEGRRIVRLSPDRDWGWEIVNHAHYRQMRSAEERREYFRNYKREKRNVSAAGGQGPQASDPPQPPPSAPQSLELPEWMLTEEIAAWDAWVRMRAEKRVPNTVEALKLAIEQLDALRGQGQNVVAVLQRSTRAGYPDLYAIKQGEAGPPTVKCGACGKPITGGWMQTEKGRTCDPCRHEYERTRAWPEKRRIA